MHNAVMLFVLVSALAGCSGRTSAGSAEPRGEAPRRVETSDGPAAAHGPDDASVRANEVEAGQEVSHPHAGDPGESVGGGVATPASPAAAPGVGVPNVTRTCGELHCQRGSTCQMVHPPCLRPPCRPTAQCVPQARP